MGAAAEEGSLRHQRNGERLFRAAREGLSIIGDCGEEKCR